MPILSKPQLARVVDCLASDFAAFNLADQVNQDISRSCYRAVESVYRRLALPWMAISQMELTKRCNYAISVRYFTVNAPKRGSNLLMPR